jgi:histone H3/H4
MGDSGALVEESSPSPKRKTGGSDVGGKKRKKIESKEAEQPDGIRLPKTTMKRIMKINTDVGSVSLDGVAAVCVATEVFLKYLAEEASKKTEASGRILMKLEDVSAAIDSKANLCFLKDAFGPLVAPPAPAVAAASSSSSEDSLSSALK